MVTDKILSIIAYCTYHRQQYKNKDDWKRNLTVYEEA